MGIFILILLTFFFAVKFLAHWNFKIIFPFNKVLLVKILKSILTRFIFSFEKLTVYE